MRLLIISAYFWPESAGTAPYITAMARRFADRGHKVEVLAGHPHYPAWRPLRSRRVFREELDGIVIRRRPHYVPPLQSVLRRALYEASLLGTFTAAMPFTTRPDAVLGVIPALSSGLVARIAHRYHRQPYGLLVHDMMGKAALESGVEGGQHVGHVVANAEMYAAKRASRIGIIAEAFRSSLEVAGIPADKIERLRTWSLAGITQAEPDRDAFGWKKSDFICLHAGSMGYKQDLNNLLDAAASAEGSVAFVLAGDGSERAGLQQRKARDRIDTAAFLDPQPSGRYEQMLASADLLLVNQRPSVTEMSLPSKLTSYFAAGKPIVAAVPAGSETAAEIEAAQAGVVIPAANPGALLDAILELRRDPDRREILGRNGRDFARKHLTPDAVLPSYERFVERIAGGS